MTAETIQAIYQQAQSLHQSGDLRAAETAYRNLLAQHPAHADALHSLGVIALQLGRFDVAMDLIQRAIKLDGSRADYYSNFAVALMNLNLNEQAAAAGRTGLQLRPDNPTAAYNLGIALEKMDRLEEAAAYYRKAIELNPNYAEAHNGVACLLLMSGEYEQAAAAFRRVIELKPDYALAHWHLAHMLLMLGDFENGWREYEWRWKVTEFAFPPRPSEPPPHWNGEDLAGKRIRITTEQGYGDAIQFIRFAKTLADRGASVIVSGPPEIQPLLATASGIDVAGQTDTVKMPDFQISMLSLPRVLRTSLQTIPSQTPYLFPLADAVQQCRDRLSELGQRKLNIGLCWSGRREPPNDANRSIPLQEFASLATIADVRFVSLQKDRPDEATPPGIELLEFANALNNFSDTAALAGALDLIISIDTAVLHLAGALGKPTWALIQFHPDCRWLMKREDSPWYPTMRLFRQSRFGDWSEPVARIAAELTTLAQRTR